MVKTMLMIKLKLIAVALLVFGLLTCGGGFFLRAVKAVTVDDGNKTAPTPQTSTAVQEPAPPKKNAAEEQTIRALISELNHDVFKKREEAQKRLAAIGLPALDLLRQAAKDGPDLETRERATQLVQEIGRLFLRSTLKDQHWGYGVDPDGDCKFRVETGTLHIKMPGKPHSLSIERGSTNAPRFLRIVEGDFTVEVEVRGAFPGDARSLVPGAWPYYAAGLLVWQDEKNYVRLERAFMYFPKKKWRCFPNWQQFGDAQMRNDLAQYDYELSEQAPTVLRIERKGDLFTGSVSQDRKEWHELPPLEAPLAKKLLVGVAALQNTPAEFEAVFENLKLAGKKAD
jgi:regulation of enolase protein 1 (concanavalin A-like superfamily)